MYEIKFSNIFILSMCKWATSSLHWPNQDKDLIQFLIFKNNVHGQDRQRGVTQHNWSYMLISSFHSSVVLLDKGRKRVVLSVEGWSKLRTQHSSPDRTHWPVDAQGHNTPSASGRKLGGNNMTRRRDNIRPLLKVTLSCWSRSRLTRTLCGTDLDPTERWSMGTWVGTQHI